MKLFLKLRTVLYLVIGIYCFLLTSEVHCQDKYLVAEKMGTKKRFVFYPGDEIIFKLKGSELEITDVITDLQDSLIVLLNSYVKPKEIDYIKLKHTTGFMSPSNGPKLIIAGVALFLIDQLNNSVIQGNDFRLDKEITYISLGMVAAGAIWTSFRYTKFRNRGNQRIRSVVL